MLEKERILLNLLFPKYIYNGNQSRFTIFFDELEKKSKIKEIKITDETKINLEKINLGEDKRTSVIIKNIPLTFTKKNLTEIIDGIGNINYLYIPFNKKTNKNEGIAFINVINYKNIIGLYERFTNYNLNKSNSEVISVFYSKIQGKYNLTRFFCSKKKKKWISYFQN